MLKSVVNAFDLPTGEAVVDVEAFMREEKGVVPAPVSMSDVPPAGYKPEDYRTLTEAELVGRCIEKDSQINLLRAQLSSALIDLKTERDRYHDLVKEVSASSAVVHSAISRPMA